jgi:hypothetical protein
MEKYWYSIEYVEEEEGGVRRDWNIVIYKGRKAVMQLMQVERKAAACRKNQRNRN